MPIINTPLRPGSSPSPAPFSCGWTLQCILLSPGMRPPTGSEMIWVETQRFEPVCDSASFPGDLPLEPPHLLRRIRKISGLTWLELAGVFKVSRRAIHNWDAGQVPTQEHLARLHALAGLITRLDKGNPVYLRSLLLKDLDGTNALVMLQQGRFKEVEARLGPLKRFPAFRELPDECLRKRLPIGVSLTSYGEEPSVEILRSMPAGSLKPPRLPKPKKP